MRKILNGRYFSLTFKSFKGLAETMQIPIAPPVLKNMNKPILETVIYEKPKGFVLIFWVKNKNSIRNQARGLFSR